MEAPQNSRFCGCLRALPSRFCGDVRARAGVVAGGCSGPVQECGQLRPIGSTDPVTERLRKVINKLSDSICRRAGVGLRKPIFAGKTAARTRVGTPLIMHGVSPRSSWVPGRSSADHAPVGDWADPPTGTSGRTHLPARVDDPPAGTSGRPTYRHEWSVPAGTGGRLSHWHERQTRLPPR